MSPRKQKYWWIIELPGINAKVANKVSTVFLILEEGPFSYFLLTSFWRVVEIKIQWRRNKKTHPTNWNKKNKNIPPHLARRSRMSFAFPLFFFFIEKPQTLSFFPQVFALCCSWELFSACSGAAPLHCTQNQQLGQSRARLCSLGWHEVPGPLLMTSSWLSHAWPVARAASRAAAHARLLLPLLSRHKSPPPHTHTPATIPEPRGGGRLFVMTSF